MAKTKSTIEWGKIDYTTVEGVPTINVAVSLTTRVQVQMVIDQLEKLMTILPEAKSRRVKPKAKATARAKANGNKEEELFGKAHD